MKSAVVLVGVLLLAGAGLYVFSEGGFGGAGALVLGEDRTYLRDRTVDFLEDLKFKDFDKASTYHLAETQAARDIPALLHRAFKIRHEVLDIQDYEVLDVELDSSGARGRVRALVRYHILGDREVREQAGSYRDLEMLFYWFRQADGSWTMELESSLRI